MRVSRTGTRSWSPSTVVGGVAIAIVLSILVALQARKAASERLWGDEGTFVAMASSLVHDGDLIFDEGDLQRLEERQVGPTPAVILQSTERGITYSKPILYPLMAAPLFSLFGEAGMLATNGVLLGLALLLAWLYLRRLGSARHSFWTLATAVFCSVLLPYLGWMMSDLAQAAMVLAGLSLALRGLPLPVEVQFEEDRHRPILTPAIGGFLLGAAVSMRFSTAALAAAPVLIAVLYRRYRHSMVVAALTLAAFALVSGATQHFLGTANPYKAVRSSFNASTGYPAGVEGDEATERFSTSPATQSASWLPSFEPRRSAYSLVYFFLGRHTGLLAYFPVALVLLFHAARRPNGVVLPLLAAAGAVAAFYLLWMPENYFGGSTFLGNRYFLVTLPAILLALRQLPSPRLLAVAWILALGFWSSGLYSVSLTRDLGSSSQSHAHAGLFRLLPFESTAKNIDGIESRYWRRDFVRFVDPFAGIGTQSFRLSSKMPAAELVVATSWPGETLKLAVQSSSPRAVLEVTDWQRSDTYPLDGSVEIAPGVLAVSLSPTWRRHGFWWEGDASYNVRSFRLEIVDPAGSEVTADVRYLGKRLPPRMRPDSTEEATPSGGGTAYSQSR
ncbi:MAG: hypothetical protein WBP67_16585 [Thermoanaerobaculia bacterium]